MVRRGDWSVPRGARERWGEGLGGAGPRWVSVRSDIEDSAVVCQRAGVARPLPLCASLTGKTDHQAIINFG